MLQSKTSKNNYLGIHQFSADSASGHLWHGAYIYLLPKDHSILERWVSKPPCDNHATVSQPHTLLPVPSLYCQAWSLWAEFPRLSHQGLLLRSSDCESLAVGKKSRPGSGMSRSGASEQFRQQHGQPPSAAQHFLGSRRAASSTTSKLPFSPAHPFLLLPQDS